VSTDTASNLTAVRADGAGGCCAAACCAAACTRLTRINSSCCPAHLGLPPKHVTCPSAPAAARHTALAAAAARSAAADPASQQMQMCSRCVPHDCTTLLECVAQTNAATGVAFYCCPATPAGSDALQAQALRYNCCMIAAAQLCCCRGKGPTWLRTLFCSASCSRRSCTNCFCAASAS